MPRDPASVPAALSRALNLAGRATDAVPTRLAARSSRRLDQDGQRIDPSLGLLLAVESRVQRRQEDATAAQRRAGLALSSRAGAGRPTPVGEVRDLAVPGGAGPLRARHYRPIGGGAGRPLVVYLHGGGWVVGDLDTHDQTCRWIATYADAQVVSVDYRLAPEDPFPAAVDDALAAFGWAAAQAAELGADPRRVAIGGDSAGGNLAAVVSQLTTEAGGPAPVAQLLVYPGVDASREYPSKALFADGYFLTRHTMDWYLNTYAAGADRSDVRMSPLLARDKSGLPPTLVTTAGFDPLRDEGRAYAAALADAGVTVVHREARNLVHGYFGMMGVNRASREESIAVIGAFAALLDAAR